MTACIPLAGLILSSESEADMWMFQKSTLLAVYSQLDVWNSMLALEEMREGTLNFQVRGWGHSALPISKNQTSLLCFKGLGMGDSILKLSWSTVAGNVALAHLWNIWSFTLTMGKQPAWGWHGLETQGRHLPSSDFFYSVASELENRVSIPWGPLSLHPQSKLCPHSPLGIFLRYRV